MNNSVKAALDGALDQYAKVSGRDYGNLKEDLVKLFNKELGFTDKLGEFDAIFNDHPVFEELREVFFDLLMINFFSNDVNRLEEDYLESEEWLAIEEDTIDRGTELLNLLLYIKECHDENIEPELGDFLKEFLLVEEDDFQDEFHIYEDLISNQQLVETSVEDICSHASMMETTEEMKDLFVPFMTFFHDHKATGPVSGQLQEFSANKEFDIAVYTLIANFNATNEQ